MKSDGLTMNKAETLLLELEFIGNNAMQNG
jgi:hypothetical protein